MGKLKLSNIKLVSEDIGYIRASIYKWRKTSCSKVSLGNMNPMGATKSWAGCITSPRLCSYPLKLNSEI